MANVDVQAAPGAALDIFSKNVRQVDVREASPDLAASNRYLIQSPYTEQEHLLDLDTLDNENTILARALGKFRAVREDYATAPYTESFNWPEVLEEVKRLALESENRFQETSFYIVAFRSRIKQTTEYADLGRLDKGAHAEAVASGGFLKYWFGEPDSELANLATCIWRSREDAKKGGTGPAHRKAAGATRSMYAFWKIDQHRLIIRDNVEDWEITPWQDSA
ncbi:hypothetical protein NW768_010283 [Fusarium equiseti]|uniref:Uncharacterized protein n=1 Tax=Fusarium equiseti TaxID=61235 RepID=A0ABQ8R0N7_FUSEQ|nr:hypothetical protein NW768_010283 [Fusarium equiseti]